MKITNWKRFTVALIVGVVLMGLITYGLGMLIRGIAGLIVLFS